MPAAAGDQRGNNEAWNTPRKASETFIFEMPSWRAISEWVMGMSASLPVLEGIHEAVIGSEEHIVSGDGGAAFDR